MRTIILMWYVSLCELYNVRLSQVSIAWCHNVDDELLPSEPWCHLVRPICYFLWCELMLGPFRCHSMLKFEMLEETVQLFPYELAKSTIQFWCELIEWGIESRIHNQDSHATSSWKYLWYLKCFLFYSKNTQILCNMFVLFSRYWFIYVARIST